MTADPENPMARRYEPGDTFTTMKDRYEFVAVADNNNGCERCMGNLHRSICDMLPTGCGEDSIAWKPSNDAAKLLLTIIKLEGIP